MRYEQDAFYSSVTDELFALLAGMADRKSIVRSVTFSRPDWHGKGHPHELSLPPRSRDNLSKYLYAGNRHLYLFVAGLRRKVARAIRLQRQPRGYR